MKDAKEYSEVVYPEDIVNTVPLLNEIKSNLKACLFDIYTTEISGQTVICTNQGYLYTSEEIKEIRLNAQFLVDSIDGLLSTHNSALIDELSKKTCDARRKLHEFSSRQDALQWKAKKRAFTLAKKTKVYLMLNTRNGLYKIGKSASPVRREKTLQSEEPEVKLVATYEAISQDEKLLHQQFYQKHVRGEWFKLENADLIQIDHYFKQDHERK